jgi:D-alanine-D-alanine ligase
MNIKEICNYLENITPIKEIPISWDNMGYVSESFNKHVSSPSFVGWQGDLPTDHEVKIIADLLEIKSGNALLDIACGYGRHSLSFAQNYDLKVTGIDISSGLIETARRHAKEKGLDVHFEARNAKNISWKECFDFAIIVSNSFSLLSPSDTGDILLHICNALKPSGRIFLDLENKYFYSQHNASHRDWEIFRKSIKLQEVYYHKEKSVEVCRDLYVFLDSDEIEEFVIFKRLYSEDEIRHILQNNGFKIKKVFGGWDLSTLHNESSKIIIVAEKEGSLGVLSKD